MKRLSAVLPAAVVVLSLSACVSQEPADSASADDAMKVGFVYVSPLQGSGWTQAWDQARETLEEELEVETSAVEPIAETADSVGVLENLVSEGNEVVFATAFGYQPFVAQVAEEHSEVTFVVIGPWAQDDPPPANVSVVSNDSWATRYALGVLAARTSETGVLGFVAANPISTVVASVNAFQLGARSVDPAVETRVVFTGTWYDPARSTQAAQTLASGGADVIAQYEDSTGTLLGAQGAEVWGIGSEVDSSELLPDTYLSGSVNDWREFATEVVRSVQDGDYEQQQVVGSIESGMATIGAFADDVPEEVRSEVEEVMSGLSDGSIVPFQGPLSSNEGEVLLAEGEEWADSETALGNQNALVEGVVGSIPST
jgi:basic membrane lipoprotein Med (substrate-binding protein (PBP1-ABC) superfamily)